MSTTCELIVAHAAELVTVAGHSQSPKRGEALADLAVIPDGAVAVADGAIAGVGPTDQILARFRCPEDRVIDAAGQTVLPGFVDPHTHLVFGGSREAEWELRMTGASYLEILRRGGGIHSTVQATRAATEEALFAAGRGWIARMLALGTTTVEIKSGYGLDREEELKLLRVAHRLDRETPMDVAATFLGAHVVPKEYQERRGEYVNLVVAMAREIGERRLAEFCDVFCEEEAFTVEESRRILEAARAAGLGLKLHAGQFTDKGGTRLGVELGAVSIDHLDHIDEEAIPVLAGSGAVGVLLPGVSFHLVIDQYPPARRLIANDVPIALATDFNPGSSCTPSMPMIIALACRMMRLTAGEAITAATINAAHALGRGDRVGSLEPGKQADLILLDLPNHRWLPYCYGWNPVTRTLKRGREVPRPD